MTRKDYINIAAAIQATQARIEGDFDRQLRDHENLNQRQNLTLGKAAQLRGVRRAAANLADFLADDNPRFDQTRFLKECGYGATTMNPRDPALDLRPLPEPAKGFKMKNCTFVNRFSDSDYRLDN